MSDREMANPGVGTTNKFASVNLNKSYGKSQTHHFHHNHHHTNTSQSNYGANRGRTTANGGGGMVVLSRPRSSQKPAPKLSVPPPLNLPSLRREHERFDSLGSGTGAGGGATSGSGARPTSSGIGWTKPVTVVLQEKQAGDQVTTLGNGNNDLSLSHSVDGVSKGSSSVYLPPSARPGIVGPAVSSFPPVEKVSVLRGEDFPSLQAAIPVISTPAQKHKDGGTQKQKQTTNEEFSNEQSNGSRHVDMRPQLQTSRQGVGHRPNERVYENNTSAGFYASEKVRKQEEYFSGPLPLVRLNPRSDWADDERDTGHSFTFTDKGRDHYGYSKTEAVWDHDFDMPRPSVPPHKPVYNAYNRTGPRDNETGKLSSGEVIKVDSPYGRDSRIPSADGRDGQSWRSTSLFKGHELVNDRNLGSARPTTLNSEKESKFAVPTAFRDNNQSDFGRRQAWNNNFDSVNTRGSEWNTRERYGNEQNNRYRNDAHQSSSVSKSPFSKGLPVSDPILNFGREKRPFAKNEKPYVEDYGATGFDASDPFSGVFGVVKKKKDVQTDFHDPVRESFEAELERVQKMQEQERKRVIEEQERALEQVRREEEERLHFVREQEERQRRLEEEARESAWRAEQEKLETVRKTEEHRIAREEEKRRSMLEEERRKQAAKQKLLELEEKIARRQAETVKGGNRNSSSVIADERLPGTSKMADYSEWEDGERMVERITTSASSDSSGLSRQYQMGPLDRGKPVNAWRRDTFENGNNSNLPTQDYENGHHSPRRDTAIGGRVFPRKEFYGGPGFNNISPRSYYKGGMPMPEPPTDDFTHFGGQRWNVPGYPEQHYNRNMEIPEFNENLEERYGEIGWGQGRARGNNSYPLYPDRQYQGPEADNLYPIGRTRYRQPRVLPPPSITSMQKPSHRVENDGASNFLETYNHLPNSEPTLHRAYENSHQKDELVGNSENITKKLDRNATPGCDSQSSLSVSSPPDSPVHLYHDDLDESGDSAVLLTAGQESDLVGLPADSGKENIMNVATPDSVDDDEGWGIENNDQLLQEQEEYDEDEEGYEEKDEGHECDDENIDLTRELEDLQLEDKDNLILGFNEGVEVGMPNDEFERSSRTEDNTYQIQDMSVGNDEQNLEPLNGVDESSGIFEETEKAMQHLVMQSNNSSLQSGATEQMDVDNVNKSGLSTQNPVSSTGQTVVSSISQPEPVKLQFGLFSGPSLIPSPVPAIQIGSIQLHLHPHQVGPSLGHMHPSQPPLFQFGQLRYSSPVSQGLLPLGTQSLSLVPPPTVPANFSLNPNPGGPLRIAVGQDASGRNLMKNGPGPGPGPIQRNLEISHGNSSRETKSTPSEKMGEGAVTMQQTRVDDDKNWSDSGFQENQGKNLKSEAQFQTGAASSHVYSKERPFSGSRNQGITSGARNKKYVFAVKNSGSRSSISSSETSRVDSHPIQRRPRRQRTEFRVRDNSDKRQSTEFRVRENSDNGKAMRNGARKVVGWNRPSKQAFESEGTSSLPVNSQDIVRGTGKESQTKSRNLSSTEGYLKRNICSEEDVDTSLQSGIVRVFEQPGIEAPSDEDDFIQVRSKRQMLNDRREQREKEIKAKSRVSKIPRKSHPTSQISSSNKLFQSVGGETANVIRSDYVATEGRKIEASSGFNNTVLSQPLAPIGTPAVKTDSKADMRPQPIKSLQTSSHSVVSGGGKSLAPALGFENNSNVLDNVKTSLGSWGNSRINQQMLIGKSHLKSALVMSLTQTQLDEAMKPGQYDSRASSGGDQSCSISEPMMPSSSILTKNMSLSSAVSPVNSLLAGEKIQFGAVTSPTILPPCSRSVSHGIGPPGPSRSEIHNMGGAASGNFFEKEKQSDVHSEDCEAEAAASAVAVAAISSDETVGNCSVSVTDTKTYGASNINGVGVDHKSGIHSRGEESLSVALPADLSVENPPISFWPPPPSPQNSSNQMISHFPGGPPSHFPFFDMNPMLGGPIFAFGPHDESMSTQPLSQKNTAPSSGPHGTWHSGVDSFYGPPSGFTGPFISTPGGVQGPPHMVVYNHFAPVGQYGQMGLSFMGTTYIPSGKQPDWKHTPASSAMGAGEGDMKNMNMVPTHCNPTNMPGPIQHLAPGSPLLPIPMFDASPFQPSPDMSRWSNAVPPPLQSVPMSMPFSQQPEPSQFNHGPPADPSSLTANKFLSEPRPMPSSDNSCFPVTTTSNVSQLPDELGLVDSSSSSGASTQNTLANSTTSASNVADVGKSVVAPDSRSGRNTNSSFKSSQQSNMAGQQQYGYQRGGGGFSQKNNSGGEWSHRRTGGFQGRNQPIGADKGFPPSKMKQIYVAKQPSTGTTSTTSS
ncbi:hypothetical protein ACFE04_022000 [Oxalis oulophora]